MSLDEIDDFASALLEEAKRFLEKASEVIKLDDATAADDSIVANVAGIAFLHAALMIAFSSLEAHINAVADEMCLAPNVTVHERGVLQEREVRLENGEFSPKNTLKMTRLEDRIQFLISRFGNQPLDRAAAWWGEFKEAARLRNELTHPKGKSEITIAQVRRALLGIIEAIDVVYRAIYQRKFPQHSRGLLSSLEF